MQHKQGLFRQQAIEAQANSFMGAVRLATPVSHQVWALTALFVALVIVTWLFVGHYTRREHVAGSLEPQAGLLTITARSHGTVTGIDVTEGTIVRAGEPLLAISGDRSSVTMGDTSALISAELRSGQARLRSDLIDTQHIASEQADDLIMQQRMLHNQMRQIDAQLAIEERQVRDLSVLLHRLQALGTQGFVSALDIQQQRTQELDAESQVKSLARQRSESEQQLRSIGDQLIQLPLATATKLNDLHQQIAQNQQALAQNEADRATELRASKDGTVSAILVKPGQTVDPGQALLSVMPKGSMLQAQLLVPSSAIGFVHNGTSVALHYQAFPYQKFGVQHGVVESVSRSALTPVEITILLGQQMSHQPLYRVMVKLDAQHVMAYGRAQTLRPGMQVDADLMLDRRRMIDWIFEPLYGMAKRVVN